ncbi:SCO2525 family SAM-dependent methyltransferase [Yinghuangia sp. ASG 101]|uniref:SCO2525 family SAM-dependent methyltransferase n=1 Tax=Yinghuangia sp. ASG 101 TaxID=2896848 RepID=UPI001E4AC7EC|nr:SCO2525 family SAM-dependent methyltransferase [Yinghuangia sp. ASG 101]UGQ10816.1 SCO2525 family SAM-dependent methyltransferase [Yinghuangia sp. ASG 101]
MPENAGYDWDLFDSQDYVARNYGVLSGADRRILETARDFLGGREFPAGTRGVDVGSGTNLYPALSMLPFCDEVSLLEHSASNVAWLREQTAAYAPLWDPYWAVLREHRAYRGIADPRAALAKRARVAQVDLLAGVEGGPWDIGTMFFVAESFSTSREEFRDALRRFHRLLRPHAPFVIAFMENSQGYEVGGRHFPAVAVESADVEGELAELAADFTVERVGLDGAPLRHGYTGMLLAHGAVK